VQSQSLEKGLTMTDNDLIKGNGADLDSVDIPDDALPKIDAADYCLAFALLLGLLLSVTRF
jgi:hypothetical protein